LRFASYSDVNCYLVGHRPILARKP
jgi:hypothetical protein